MHCSTTHLCRNIWSLGSSSFHQISLLPIHRHIKPLVHGKGLKEQQNSTSCSDAILHFHAQAQLLRSIYVADFIPVHSKFQSSPESSPHPFQVIVLPPLILYHALQKYFISVSIVIRSLFQRECGSPVPVQCSDCRQPNMTMHGEVL